LFVSRFDQLPKETLEKWTTYNCSECDVMNRALKAGAKWEDLREMHTMKFDPKKRAYSDVERCKNCKIAYEDKKVTSDP
jgi:hypothetical protein